MPPPIQGTGRGTTDSIVQANQRGTRARGAAGASSSAYAGSRAQTSSQRQETRDLPVGDTERTQPHQTRGGYVSDHSSRRGSVGGARGGYEASGYQDRSARGESSRPATRGYERAPVRDRRDPPRADRAAPVSPQSRRDYVDDRGEFHVGALENRYISRGARSSHGSGYQGIDLGGDRGYYRTQRATATRRNAFEGYEKPWTDPRYRARRDRYEGSQAPADRLRFDRSKKDVTRGERFNYWFKNFSNSRMRSEELSFRDRSGELNHLNQAKVAKLSARLESEFRHAVRKGGADGIRAMHEVADIARKIEKNYYSKFVLDIRGNKVEDRSFKRIQGIINRYNIAMLASEQQNARLNDYYEQHRIGSIATKQEFVSEYLRHANNGMFNNSDRTNLDFLAWFKLTDRTTLHASIRENTHNALSAEQRRAAASGTDPLEVSTQDLLDLIQDNVSQDSVERMRLLKDIDEALLESRHFSSRDITDLYHLLDGIFSDSDARARDHYSLIILSSIANRGSMLRMTLREYRENYEDREVRRLAQQGGQSSSSSASTSRRASTSSRTGAAGSRPERTGDDVTAGEESDFGGLLDRTTGRTYRTRAERDAAVAARQDAQQTGSRGESTQTRTGQRVDRGQQTHDDGYDSRSGSRRNDTRDDARRDTGRGEGSGRHVSGLERSSERTDRSGYEARGEQPRRVPGYQDSDGGVAGSQRGSSSETGSRRGSQVGSRRGSQAGATGGRTSGADSGAGGRRSSASASRLNIPTYHHNLSSDSEFEQDELQALLNQQQVISSRLRDVSQDANNFYDELGTASSENYDLIKDDYEKSVKLESSLRAELIQIRLKIDTLRDRQRASGRDGRDSDRGGRSDRGRIPSASGQPRVSPDSIESRGRRRIVRDTRPDPTPNLLNYLDQYKDWPKMNIYHWLNDLIKAYVDTEVVSDLISGPEPRPIPSMEDLITTIRQNMSVRHMHELVIGLSKLKADGYLSNEMMWMLNEAAKHPDRTKPFFKGMLKHFKTVYTQVITDITPSADQRHNDRDIPGAEAAYTRRLDNWSAQIEGQLAQGPLLMPLLNMAARDLGNLYVPEFDTPEMLRMHIARMSGPNERAPFEAALAQFADALGVHPNDKEAFKLAMYIKELDRPAVADWIKRGLEDNKGVREHSDAVKAAIVHEMVLLGRKCLARSDIYHGFITAIIKFPDWDYTGENN